VEDVIHCGFQELIGDAFRYDILVVHDIRLAPSGKFQTVIPLPAEAVPSQS